ncbi:MAG TPA: glycosyltransferase family 2 protein [Candidatus Kapabacteria bacterium]|jgi:hypothetical protein
MVSQLVSMGIKTMNTQTSKVGIIIINLNSYEDTSRCISALHESSYSNTELILVDNGSIDRSGERLNVEFHPDVYLRFEENIGSTGGRNAGMKRAIDDGCDYVLLLDDDSIVTASFLDPLVEKLDTTASIAAVTGKIYTPARDKSGRANIIWYAGSERKWHTWFNHRGMNKEDKGQYDVGTFVVAMPACLMMMRSTILKEIGLFSDDYFVYWEEADWCARALKAGYQCYFEPQSTIIHNFKSNIPGRETEFYNYLQFRNALVFNALHNSFLKKIQFVLTLPVLLAHRTLRSVKVKNFSGIRASLDGIVDYFRGFRGNVGLVERGILQK